MVSKFYYLQIADWERGYRPDWKDLSLMEWIEKAELKDDNLIVRKLVDKSFTEPIDETDLMLAKAILRRRVVVGLMKEMEESVKRFNIVMGIDDSLESNQKCMNEYFGKSKDSGVKNSNKHPKVRQDILLTYCLNSLHFYLSNYYSSCRLLKTLQSGSCLRKKNGWI
jgi:hypothetical protein